MRTDIYTHVNIKLAFDSLFQKVCMAPTSYFGSVHLIFFACISNFVSELESKEIISMS